MMLILINGVNCYHQGITLVFLTSRVESGSDDPDNLGHFFGGSSGSHPQIKLSGCDPDVTCSLENSVGIW